MRFKRALPEGLDWCLRLVQRAGARVKRIRVRARVTVRVSVRVAVMVRLRLGVGCTV